MKILPPAIIGALMALLFVFIMPHVIPNVNESDTGQLKKETPLNLIHDLGLNETVQISQYLVYIRVPGGWVLYTKPKVYDEIHLSSRGVFIPYSEEFSKASESSSALEPP